MKQESPIRPNRVYRHHLGQPGSVEEANTEGQEALEKAAHLYGGQPNSPAPINYPSYERMRTT